jgi:AcrR family transcriptional regulator
MRSQAAKSPRRKPKQARAQETMEILLEAAARVLRDHGYAHATTNRIAEAAGVSVGTVYEYFANKDAVFDRLIARELDALVAAFEAQGAGADLDLETSLLRLVEAGLGAMRFGPELFRALESVPGAAFRSRLGDARATVVALVSRLLEAHRREVKVADLDLAAFLIVSAVEGIGANLHSSQLDARLASEITSLVTRYLQGSTTTGVPGG